MLVLTASSVQKSTGLAQKEAREKHTCMQLSLKGGFLKGIKPKQLNDSEPGHTPLT